MLWRYPDACISDGDLDLVVLPESPHRDRATLLNRLRGVHENVHEYLVQLVWKAFDFRHVRKVLHDTYAILELMPQQSNRAFDAFVDVDLLPFGFIQPREVSQASNNFHDAIRRRVIVSTHFVEDV